MVVWSCRPSPARVGVDNVRSDNTNTKTASVKNPQCKSSVTALLGMFGLLGSSAKLVLS